MNVYERILTDFEIEPTRHHSCFLKLMFDKFTTSFCFQQVKAHVVVADLDIEDDKIVAMFDLFIKRGILKEQGEMKEDNGIILYFFSR